MTQNINIIFGTFSLDAVRLYIKMHDELSRALQVSRLNGCPYCHGEYGNTNTFGWETRLAIRIEELMLQAVLKKHGFGEGDVKQISQVEHANIIWKNGMLMFTECTSHTYILGLAAQLRHPKREE